MQKVSKRVQATKKPEVKKPAKKAPLKAEILAEKEAEHNRTVEAMAAIWRRDHRRSVRRIIREFLGDEFDAVIKEK